MNIEKFLNPALNDAPKDESSIICNMADKMEAEGISIIHMDLGRPDFDSPASVKEKTIQALKEGKVYYTSLNGIFELKKAIAEREARDHNLYIDPNDNVLVTVGASEALFHSWLNFLRPGDEVLMPTPCYCAYLYILKCLGVNVVEVPIIKNCKADFNIKDFHKKLSPRTRMIVVNTPQNPTGMVLNREQLEQLAEFAKINDLLVVSDECYDNYLFSGEHISIATLPGMWERTITVNSVSKTYSMTGWRVGYAVARKEFIDVMAVSHGNMILCAPSFAQYGAAEAIANIKHEVTIMREEFMKRRDCVVRWMNMIDCLPYVRPEGAFYLFFDISSLDMDGFQFCFELLKKYHITAMPGSIYGSDYHNYVRLAYTCSYEDLEDGMERIAEFIKIIKAKL